MTGLLPNTLRSIQAVISVTQALDRVATEYYEAAGRQYTDGCIPDISVPIEVRYFLLKTDGLCDPGFRYENKCGWSLVDDIERSNIGDPAAFENDAEKAFRAALVTPGELSSSLRKVLDVIVGIATERSTTEDNRVGWQSFHLFCRQRQKQGKHNSTSTFAWRFCFSPLKQATDAAAYRLPPVFDSLHSLLTWNGGGADAPGLDKRVTTMYDDWDTDSDSATEAKERGRKYGRHP